MENSKDTLILKHIKFDQHGYFNPINHQNIINGYHQLSNLIDDKNNFEKVFENTRFIYVKDKYFIVHPLSLLSLQTIGKGSYLNMNKFSNLLICILPNNERYFIELSSSHNLIGIKDVNGNYIYNIHDKILRKIAIICGLSKLINVDINDIEECKLILQYNHSLLAHIAPSIISKNVDLVKLALKYNANEIKHVDNTKDILSMEDVLYIVRTNGKLIKYIDDYFISPYLYLEAIYSNPFVLENIPDIYKPLITYDVYKYIVNTDGNSIQLVPKDIRNRELCIDALNNTPEALQYISKNVPYYNELLEIYDNVKIKNDLTKSYDDKNDKIFTNLENFLSRLDKTFFSNS